LFFLRFLFFIQAYVEFFVSPEKWEKMQGVLERLEWRERISYVATRGRDQNTESNPPSLSEAVTWGIYPGREVITPTRVDVDGHRAWAAEAFALLCLRWTSRSMAIPLTTAWWLVILVDEDFTRGDGIWELVEAVELS
jgi:methylenetetrahydrofolate reductase (NADPH)